MSETEWSLVQQLIVLVITVSLPVLLRWLGKVWAERQAQLRQSEEWLALEEVVATAVRAAEQLGFTDELTKYANSKLEYAIRTAEQMMHARGIMLDLDEPAAMIRALIEAEVLRLKREPETLHVTG